MFSKIRGSVAVMGALLLASCSLVPDSGPSRRDVENKATVSVGALAQTILDYVLIDLNKTVLPYITDPGAGSLYKTFGAGRGPVPVTLVGVGDTIQVTLFEAQAGGLFIPSDAGSRPGNFVTLPSVTVDSAGNITVPYAGQIKVRGRATADIEAEIVSKLKNRAIEPQAVVAILSQSSFQATVVGDVGAPGKLTINAAGDHVLDLIARAGGIKNPGYEEFVTLERNGRKGTLFFLNLLSPSQENIFISPGDVIYVQDNPRNFMAFGATGASGQFKFQQESLTLSDAVGKAGGLLDARAEPGQVFVYRIESRITLEKMGADMSKFAANREAIPTIFRVNFRDPSGFFAARRFPMRDSDIIYVDNADQVEVTKFLALLTTVTGSLSVVAGDAANVKAASNYLRGNCVATAYC